MIDKFLATYTTMSCKMWPGVDYAVLTMSPISQNAPIMIMATCKNCIDHYLCASFNTLTMSGKEFLLNRYALPLKYLTRDQPGTIFLKPGLHFRLTMSGIFWNVSIKRKAMCKVCFQF